jgi:hypothetical protein
MLASDLKKIKMHGHPREKGISNLNQRHPITLRFGSLSWALNWGWRLHDACFVENSSNGICWLCSYREPILDPISLDANLLLAINTGNGIVEADELNVPAIAARTAVSNKDSVERQLLAAKPH